jgi:hypothetical protein
MRTAEHELANGIENAMRQAPARQGPDDDDDLELAATERTKMTDLAKAGALPPVEEDGYGQDVEMDVLSEAPEIDTTRADKPPVVTPVCLTRTRRVFLLLVCASAIASAVLVGIYAADLYERDCDASLLSDSYLVDSIGKRVVSMSNSTEALVQEACVRTKEMIASV